MYSFRSAGFFEFQVMLHHFLQVVALIVIAYAIVLEDKRRSTSHDLQMQIRNSKLKYQAGKVNCFMTYDQNRAGLVEKKWLGHNLRYARMSEHDLGNWEKLSWDD